METFSCPSHSWTLAISAPLANALLAPVARIECTQTPMASPLMLGQFRILHDDVVIDGARIEVLIKRPCAIVRHRPEEGRVQAFMAHPPAVLPRFEVFTDKPQHHRVNGNKPDFVALAVDAKMHDALAALHIAQPEQAQLLTADAVIEQGGEDGAVPYTLQRVRGRGLQQTPHLRIAERRRAALIINYYY